MAKKVKLPKQIGGVKIPKDVRHHGGALIAALLEHARGPVGHQAMMEVMGEVFRTTIDTLAREAVQAMTQGLAPSPSPEPRTPPRRPPPPIAPESVTPPRPPVPPMPPAGAAQELPRDPAPPFGPELSPEVARVIGSVAAGLEKWAAKLGTPKG